MFKYLADFFFQGFQNISLTTNLEGSTVLSFLGAKPKLKVDAMDVFGGRVALGTTGSLSRHGIL